MADLAAPIALVAAMAGAAAAGFSDDCDKGLPKSDAGRAVQASPSDPGPPKRRPDTCATVTLQDDNDAFWNGGDRYYTQGLRLKVTSSEVTENGRFLGIRDFVGGLGALPESGRRRSSFGLGHNLHTPANIVEPNRIPQDRPYAGWAYLGFGATSQRPVQDGFELLESMELEIGLVGTGAGGKAAQTKYHDLIGVNLPRGWTNQMDNEPGLVAYREWQWRSPDIAPGLIENARTADFTPRAGFALGNVHTYGAVGATWRVGYNLPDDFGPSGIRPGLPGSSFSVPTDGYSAHGFFGGEQRLVARNIFLDGGILGDDPRVEKKVFVRDVYAGVAFQIFTLTMSFAEVFRSPEFEGQSKRHQFGAIAFSWRF